MGYAIVTYGGGEAEWRRCGAMRQLYGSHIFLQVGLMVRILDRFALCSNNEWILFSAGYCCRYA